MIFTVVVYANKNGQKKQRAWSHTWTTSSLLEAPFGSWSFPSIRIWAPDNFLISVITEPAFPRRQPIWWDETRSFAVTVFSLLSGVALIILDTTRRTASCAADILSSGCCISCFRHKCQHCFLLTEPTTKEFQPVYKSYMELIGHLKAYLTATPTIASKLKTKIKFSIKKSACREH